MTLRSRLRAAAGASCDPLLAGLGVAASGLLLLAACAAVATYAGMMAFLIPTWPTPSPRLEP